MSKIELKHCKSHLNTIYRAEKLFGKIYILVPSVSPSVRPYVSPYVRPYVRPSQVPLAPTLLQ